MNAKQTQAIRQHGEKLLAIFPDAQERDPITLCKKLRRFESQAASIALRLCNGPQYPEGYAEKATDAILGKVNALLGNVRACYQPKTGAKCGCKRGQERDNCAACEGTGYAIDFAAIRARKSQPAREPVPVFINLDPRGYALKIDDEWMRRKDAKLHTDMGGYGIIAPEIK